MRGGAGKLIAELVDSIKINTVTRTKNDDNKIINDDQK